MNARARGPPSASVARNSGRAITSTPFISVAKRGYCPDNPVHMLYRLMFHGVKRIGQDLPPDGPLRIYKDVHRMAPVIQPMLTLVVSKTVLDACT